MRHAHHMRYPDGVWPALHPAWDSSTVFPAVDTAPTGPMGPGRLGLRSWAVVGRSERGVCQGPDAVCAV
ncbi:hypothetical protein RSOL_099810 [Rhizoctonia solani AG-3 Rhs1AP]|uniref:Uncharacterized protein n=1 Tax=Rhizoctonia solani AG-3 Rhs1AP TaxID=1086054 RepID=X8J120_9AGAM|nr:hypothetical protein RSOL_099810 [Rhizoctonia solani AG-3 Rhs1AP]